MTFGEKLQLLRKQKGLSQEQLASQLAVSRQAVSKWELDNAMPDVENIIMLSELFDVTTDYLLKASIENTQKETMAVVSKKDKYITISGIVCVLLSCISYFTVWLLAKLYPAPLVHYNTETQLWKVGLDNFIWVHGLENFMLIIGMVFIIGLGLIFHKQIKRLYLLLRAKLQLLRVKLIRTK